MKHICLNLKRFDIPREYGGTNFTAIQDFGKQTVQKLEQGLQAYREKAEFQIFVPESQIMQAVEAKQDPWLHIGSQGVHWDDIQISGNFGAFTTLLPASAVKAAGGDCVLIGHCEERNAKAYVLRQGGGNQFSAINRILREEIRCAVSRNMKVVYCVGENEEETDCWRNVIGEQLSLGLEAIPGSFVTIAYEPIWSIGPGKTPASKEHIERVASFIKEKTGGLPVIYGGGLKRENVSMLASIEAIDGGLVALTRFTGNKSSQACCPLYPEGTVSKGRKKI